MSSCSDITSPPDQRTFPINWRHQYCKIRIALRFRHPTLHPMVSEPNSRNHTTIKRVPKRLKKILEHFIGRVKADEWKHEREKRYWFMSQGAVHTHKRPLKRLLWEKSCCCRITIVITCRLLRQRFRLGYSNNNNSQQHRAQIHTGRPKKKTTQYTIIIIIIMVGIYKKIRWYAGDCTTLYVYMYIILSFDFRLARWKPKTPFFASLSRTHTESQKLKFDNSVVSFVFRVAAAMGPALHAQKKNTFRSRNCVGLFVIETWWNCDFTPRLHRYIAI